MTESMENRSRVKKFRDSKLVRWVVAIPLALGLLIHIASYMLDEPLRSRLENKLNHDLKGYSVRLPGAHAQVIDLSLTLKGLTILQEAHPDPPVAYIPTLKASIHWREIITGKLVAEFVLDKPKLNINLQQLRSEAASKIPLKERGWQQAVEDIYPLKINMLRINDASVTYIDQDPKKPLVLSHLNLQAKNIRNIRQPDQVYPSSFHLDTAIFGTGHGRIDGVANFLGEPYPGIKGSLVLEKVPVDHLGTVSHHSNLTILGGLLRASGEAEYSPKVKIARLENLTIQGMKVDYIHSKRTADAEKKRIALLEKTARELSNKPGLLIRADQLNLIGCTLGLVNKAARKPYRIFIADTEFHLNNFSNQFSEGPAKARLKAKFMGSGITTGSVIFRPAKAGPDLDLYMKVEDTEMKSMNDLLRSYLDFDVSAGTFSLVTEIHVKDDAISGYIKPFFKDMKVYGSREDKERGFGHKMYEKMIGGVARILENRPDQQVATKADISGRVGKPEISTLQIVVQLIKNAFFKAILPVFERKPTGTDKR